MITEILFMNICFFDLDKRSLLSLALSCFRRIFHAMHTDILQKLRKRNHPPQPTKRQTPRRGNLHRSPTRTGDSDDYQNKNSSD